MVKMSGLGRLVGAGRSGVFLARLQQQTIVSGWSSMSCVREDVRKETMIMRGRSGERCVEIRSRVRQASWSGR
jgi:hypothetical protein